MRPVLVIAEDVDRCKPILDALRALRVPVRLMHAGKSIIDLQRNTIAPGAVVYNRASPSARQRGNEGAIAFARTALEWFRLHDAVVLNGDRSTLLETSHATQMMACARSGIRIPRTIIVHGPDLLTRAAKDIVPSLAENALLASTHSRVDGAESRALYVKPDMGGSSLDVRRCTNLRNVHTASRLQFPDRMAVVQEEIRGRHALSVMRAPPSASGGALTDLVGIRRQTFRLEFVDGEILYLLRILSSGTTRDLCPCSDKDNKIIAKFDIVDKPPPTSDDEWCDFCERCADVVRSYELFTAAFEFAVDPDGHPIVFDVNVNTNYNTDAESRAKRESGYVRIAKAIAARASAPITLTRTHERAGRGTPTAPGGASRSALPAVSAPTEMTRKSCQTGKRGRPRMRLFQSRASETPRS